MLSTKIITDSL